ncbi:proline-rich protein 19 [Anableps anableps]
MSGLRSSAAQRNADSVCCQATRDSRAKKNNRTVLVRSPCSMSHVSGRSSSEKNNLSKQSRATDKKCCCVTTLTGDSKYFNHDKDKQHKIRRLKTRKERCQMRADRKDTLKNKSHHHHCFCQSRKDLTYYPNCCHSCHLPTRKNTPISSTVPVTQEPSIITDSRLIGHHGLFNHEVKSINIERVLSEQSTLGQSEEKTNENNKISNLSSAPSNTVLLSSDGLLGADADVPVKQKANNTTKSRDSQEIKMMNLQFSNPGADITPGQRSQQQLYSSCESVKSTNQSKNSFQATKTKNTDSCMSEMDEALQVKPLARRDKTKTLNSTINGDQDYPVQGDFQISSPLQHVTSLSAERFDQQHLHRDPDHVSKTTHAVAARLSKCLHLPVPNRRNLLSETREVLLKSLQERHGPCLQANLQEVQRSLRLFKEPSQASMEQEQHMMGEDKLLSTDASVKTTGSECFCWTSSPQSRNNLQQIPEELENPVDTFVNLLDETFRPGFSPHLYMDFEPSGTSSNHLQAFGQFSPFHPNFRPNPTDMMHFPPSHMLERNLAPPSSSLPSPEHWSFPPMRLY